MSAVEDPRPLNIVGWDSFTAERKEKIRAAKDAADLGFLIQPREAVPGCGRVLAIVDRPDFASDLIVVTIPTPENLTRALQMYYDDHRAGVLVEFFDDALTGMGLTAVEVQDGKALVRFN